MQHVIGQDGVHLGQTQAVYRLSFPFQERHILRRPLPAAECYVSRQWLYPVKRGSGKGGRQLGEKAAGSTTDLDGIRDFSLFFNGLAEKQESALVKPAVA